MAITIPIAQAVGLLLLTLGSLVPTDDRQGAFLVLPPTDTLRESAGWTGLAGPLGTQIVWGDAGALRQHGLRVIAALEGYGTLCGVRS